MRHYNSGLKTWVHNYMMRVRTNGTTAVAIRPDGKTLVFTGSGPGVWSSNSTIAERLTRLNPATGADPTWALVTANDAVELYDGNGLPKSITVRGGRGVRMTYSDGALQSVVDDFGRSLSFVYDSQGRLSNVAAPGGETIRYDYGSNGHLAMVSYADNTTRQYLYENASFPYALTGLIDQSGQRFATWSYDSVGRAISSEHAGGVERYSLAFDPDGLSVLVTDPLGAQRLLQHHNIAGRLVFGGSTQPCSDCTGDAASTVVNGIGKVTQSTDFAGVANQYTYDEVRQLPVGVTHAAGRPEAQDKRIVWHPTFRVPTLVTEAGRTIAFTYDNLGNKLSETLTDTATNQARTWVWTYNDKALPATMAEPKGGVWRYDYDANGNRTSIVNPLGQQTSYSYDEAGRVTGQTDPNGLVTVYSYDARGRLTAQNRGGEVSTFFYAPTGQLAAASMPSGYRVNYSYDAAQRLIAASDNRGNSVEYTLDAMGNRVREEVKDGAGNIALVTGRIINSLNRVAATQGSVGQTTALGYDANGVAISQTDPLNQTTRQSLDGLRRPISTAFADNTQASQTWNQLGQLTQVTDPKGVQTNYQTNAFGEVMSESSPDTGTTAYTRDANGEVIAVRDAKGSTSTITRDALGRPVEIKYAPDHIAYFSYDQAQAGYLNKIEDKSGSTRYERDAQGRVTAKTQTVNDNLNNPTQLKVSYAYQGGELATVTYPSGLKVFYKRAAGRITGIDVQPPPNPSGKIPAVIPFVSDLTHSALGQPRSWTWRSGDTASRSFDTDGRMTQSEISSYSYDAASRITGITQSLWAQRTVTAVVNGKARMVTELYQTPISWTAGYDARNRLISFARNGASAAYSYDANGNRLTAVDQTSSDADLEGAFDQPNFTQSTSQSLAIDSVSNKLLGFSQTLTRTQANGAVSTVVIPVNYSLDANGAITSDGLRTFEYDESRRLAKVKILKGGESAAVSYLHNALGQRVFKSEPQAEQALPIEENLGPGFINWLRRGFGWLFSPENGSKASIGMSFAYDEDGNLLGEYDNGSALDKSTMEYIWLPTDAGEAVPIGIYRKARLYAVHADHLGTPRLITDADKQPVWQWPYSGFGNNKATGALAATPTGNGQLTLKGTNTVIEVNLRLPGQYFDDESNLSYNYSRSFDAAQGRYTQPDPTGLGGGWNRFLYVYGNPVSFSDPMGLQAYNGQTPPSSIPGGPWTPAGAGQQPGTFYGPKQPSGPRVECRYVPDEGNGGTKGAKDGYWKTKEPGQNGWSRFDQNGNPITPEQAHPGNQSSRPMSPLGVPGWMPLYPLFCPLCNVMFPPANGPS